MTLPSPLLLLRAAVDVGSNSVTTVVAEKAYGVWREVAGSSVVTGLGAGLEASGRLRPEGVAATLAALAEAWRDAVARGAEVVAAGTAALRLAADAPDFRSAAAARGTPLAILSGVEEAALGTRAVLGDPDLRLGEETAILDVGGRSTEFTLVSRGAERFARSLPFGTLRIRAESLDGGPEGRVSGPRLFAASAALDGAIAAEYDPARSPFPEFAASGETVVAVGSGPAALVAAREGMTLWDAARIRGARLEYEEIGRAVGWLMPMSDAERAAALPFAPALGRTLPACSLILERLLHALRAESLVVSTRGWRHACLEDDVFADLRRRSIT